MAQPAVLNGEDIDFLQPVVLSSCVTAKGNRMLAVPQTDAVRSAPAMQVVAEEG